MKYTILLMAVLGNCHGEAPDIHAKKKLPDVDYEEILAIKQFFYGTAYGCTYVVVRLSDNATQEPPAYKGRSWRRTPLDTVTLAHESNWHPGREGCLRDAGRGNDLDGAGLEGFAEKAREIISKPGAWVRIYGSPEHQVLQLYAPRERLALYMRFGD